MKLPAFDPSSPQTFKGDVSACNPSMQLLNHYQDPCQSLADREANDGNGEKKIQLELSGIEGELSEPAKCDP